ncbi:MAG: hypothetical protein K0U41_01035 [Gammaproteobacteria bacterium]|nr:hypothetical protein [Gammaproteobacteria bacterium]
MKVSINLAIKSYLQSSDKSFKDARSKLALFLFKSLGKIEVRMKENIRTRLNVRSGSLLNSPQREVKKTVSGVRGTMGPEGVPYAGVQEFGHTFPARYVKPRNKLALKWSANGGTFFSKGHTIPSFEVKGVHYMEDAIKDTVDIIEQDYAKLIEDTLGAE